MLLSRYRKARAKLGFGRKIRIGGEIQKTRPALTESSWNLRNTQLLKRERAAELFIKANRFLDLARQALQRVGGPRRGRTDGHRVCAGASLGRERSEDARSLECVVFELSVDRAFELAVGVYVHRRRVRSG